MTASSPWTPTASLQFFLHAAKFIPEYNQLYSPLDASGTQGKIQNDLLPGSPGIVPDLTSTSGGNNTHQALEIFQNDFEAKLCSRFQKSQIPRVVPATWAFCSPLRSTKVDTQQTRVPQAPPPSPLLYCAPRLLQGKHPSVQWPRKVIYPFCICTSVQNVEGLVSVALETVPRHPGVSSIFAGE